MMHSSILKGWVGRGALSLALMVGAVAVFLMTGGLGGDGGVLAQQADCDATGGTAPTFAGNLDTNLDVDENTPPGVNIGDPISATDPDEGTREYGDALTYSLIGDDATSFDIDASTGQLITKAALDAEATRPAYTVTVCAEDSTGNKAGQDVTITVTDKVEPPAAPAAPTVVSGPDDNLDDENELSTTTLKVVWHPPENTGDRINGYDVQYRKTTELAYKDMNHSGTGTTVNIAALAADTSYHVRVRATNFEGMGPWSLVGTGSTNKEGNKPPAFPDGAGMRQVYENTPAGEDIGSAVTAEDADATSLTYRLEGPDAGLFAFVMSTGQIRIKSPLNHENPKCGYSAPANQGAQTSCTYMVTVVVFDGAGGSDAKTVNIKVDDRNESVLAPARPTVRATEKWSTRLDVSWKVPANTGAPITGYKVRYREGSSGSFLDDNCDSDAVDNCINITGTKTTIVGLNAGKSHQVQVKTMIAGGRESAWSDSGTGSTNSANKEPRFDDRPSSSSGSMPEPPGDSDIRTYLHHHSERG